MFHKKTLLTFAVLGLILTAGIGTSYAYSGNFQGGNKLTDDQRQEIQARHEDVQAAIELGDYSLWLETVGTDSPMAEQVTEAEFPTLVQAHNLMQDARENMDEAHDLMESIGVERGFGPGGMGRGGYGMHQGQRLGNRISE